MDVDAPHADTAGNHSCELKENVVANSFPVAANATAFVEKPASVAPTKQVSPVKSNKPPRLVVSPAKQVTQEKDDSIPDSEDDEGKGPEKVKPLPDKAAEEGKGPEKEKVVPDKAAEEGKGPEKVKVVPEKAVEGGKGAEKVKVVPEKAAVTSSLPQKRKLEGDKGSSSQESSDCELAAASFPALFHLQR
eukprot:1276255-Rhodomonas_salina.1